MHSEVGISRLYADFQKLQLVGIALVGSVAASVMDQPVGVVWRRAEDGHEETLAESGKGLTGRLVCFTKLPFMSEG